MKTNVLYYGDNLDILRNHIPDESIDLIYLDPPFNSNRSYNIIFREDTGAASAAQIEAFEDTWNWAGAAATYDEVIRGPHQEVARLLQAMVDGVGHNDVTAYLTMMAIRLVELHRVLKPTGSIYLHCDPTVGHYLKILMDAVFGPRNFLSDIIRVRGNPGGRTAMSNRFGTNHDFILMYAKQRGLHYFSPQTRPQRDEYIRTHYRHSDSHGIFQDVRLQNPSPERLKELDAAGLIYYTKRGTPRLKRYLSDAKVEGALVDAIWGERGVDEEANIRDLNSQAKERLSYPTQKPLALLERIVNASSNPGDVVLDPFCGCGTAVHAAHKLGRRWIGIDITHLAIGLIRRRMRDAFTGIEMEVIGEPVDLSGAHDLAKRDKYQFQWWALDRLGAQPVSGKKKGADKGIDGVIPFFAGPKEDYKRAIVSVKGGEHVGVAMVRDLVGVLKREKQPIGILLTLTPPTKDMVTEAAAAGFYDSEFWKKKFSRVQIITIEDMLDGKRPDIPWGKAPFAKAPTEKEKAQQDTLL